MAYWLIKSEPDSFSWQEQLANIVEPWTGVRNHQAKKNLAAMRLGDKAFFYHSNTGREIVGIVEIVKEAYPDPTDETGKWVCVDVKAYSSLPHPVTLQQIKANPALSELALIRQSRLSVSPVSDKHWDILCKMGRV